jgi:hypothetical protein
MTKMTNNTNRPMLPSLRELLRRAHRQEQQAANSPSGPPYPGAQKRMSPEDQKSQLKSVIEMALALTADNFDYPSFSNASGEPPCNLKGDGKT